MKAMVVTDQAAGTARGEAGGAARTAGGDKRRRCSDSGIAK